MTILIKAATGLVAGVVAGALGLAFLPREPNAVRPRAAVEKPQFVAADAKAKPATSPTSRATPAVAIAAETGERDKPSPAASEANPAPAPQPKAAPIAVAKLDPAKPATPPVSTTRALAFAEPSTPVAPIPSPTTSAVKPAVATLGPPSLAKPAAQALVQVLAVAKPTAEAAKPSAVASENSARWSVRGLLALARGDLSSARVDLARASEAGDPRALVALADTYDPAVLAKLGVVGAPGDAQRAKDYLIKAAAAGVVVAKDRMAALDQTTQ